MLAHGDKPSHASCSGGGFSKRARKYARAFDHPARFFQQLHSMNEMGEAANRLLLSRQESSPVDCDFPSVALQKLEAFAVDFQTTNVLGEIHPRRCQHLRYFGHTICDLRRFLVVSSARLLGQHYTEMYHQLIGPGFKITRRKRLKKFDFFSHTFLSMKKK